MVTENKRIIKKFAVEILGCGCPDEVFHTIETEIIAFPFVEMTEIQRILIGNRLLIYLIECPEDESMKMVLPKLIQEGTAERDMKGYNRFRLVVYGKQCDIIAEKIRSLCTPYTNNDNRFFLHVQDWETVNEMLIGCQAS